MTLEKIGQNQYNGFGKLQDQPKRRQTTKNIWLEKNGLVGSDVECQKE
jgi:hypothetical protein